MLTITPLIQVPLTEFKFAAVHSSGPGGQNVNKVNSKVQLHWNIAQSPSLDEETRILLISKLGKKVNQEGELVVQSDRFRDQIRNREDCIEKLSKWVAQASHQPKARKKTKPSRSSREVAKVAKKKHAEKKSLRRVKKGSY